jgi:hypothetical protein
MGTRLLTVNGILDGHVGLDLACFDRIALHGWVPNLQVGGQMVSFLTHHLRPPIPSPAVLEKIGLWFGRAVTEFAGGQRHSGDPLHQGRAQTPGDASRAPGSAMDRLAAEWRSEVAAIGVGQEFQRTCTGTIYHSEAGGGGIPRFGSHKADRRVTAYYSYLVGAVFGPAFVKVCALQTRRYHRGLSGTCGFWSGWLPARCPFGVLAADYLPLLYQVFLFHVPSVFI